MEPNSRKNGLQAKLENIKLDLGTYKVLLNFQNHKDPLVIHFDKPARRFYFSLIALVVTEMKNLDKPEFIYIRKHEKTLKLLDNSLAGPNASKTAKGMWDKIRKTWRYILPDLETGAHFKILDRNLISPYEKGGKYRYDCSGDECDIWANLFDCDENNPWRFKFAIDSVSITLNDISVTLGDLRDNSAWQEFVKNLSKPKAVRREKRAIPRWWKKMAFSLVAISIVAVVTAVLWTSYMRPVSPTAEVELSDKPSIAVLPFVNMSSDPKQEYFSDGITDDLITSLSKISGLFVIARNSTFVYKEKSLKVQKIAKELGVRYILEGSVRKAGNQVRINAQLIDATTGHHLWAERFDGTFGDIFALQDRFTREIVTALAVKLTAEDESLLARGGTDNAEAYDSYLQGWEHQRLTTRDDLAKAVEYFKKAIKLDPDYARAHAALAHAYQTIIVRNWAVDLGWTDVPSLAKKHLQIALKNPTPLAHRVASFLYVYRRQYAEAMAEIEKALGLDPNDAENHLRMGFVLIYEGGSDKAIDSIRRAMRLNPHYPGLYLYYLGVAQYCLGRYEETSASLERALQLDPGQSPWWLAASYAQLGREQEAVDMLTEYMKSRGKRMISVESMFQYFPLKNQLDMDRFADGLIKAGLPRPMNPVYRHKYAEGIAEAERVLGNAPNDAKAHLIMAESLIFAGRSVEALDFIKKAMSLDPDYPPIYLYTLGLAQFCLEQYEEALTSLEMFFDKHYKKGRIHPIWGYLRASGPKSGCSRCATKVYGKEKILEGVHGRNGTEILPS
jgi:TolB-like protein/predicted Zn-dependent protease